MSTPRRRWRWPFKADVQQEVEEELSFHLEMRARELETRGLSADDARREARHRFGDLGTIAAACRRLGENRERKVRRAMFLGELAQDVRHALRQFRRSKSFTAIAVLTLSLGIGATTAIFSVVDGVLLRSLPYPDADRLVVPLSEDRGSGGRWAVAYADYEDWRRERVFDHVALYTVASLNTVGEGEPERLRAAFITEEFFATMGLAPLMGTFPSPDQFRVGTPRTAVISYALWQRRFGGADAVGQEIEIAGAPADIVAVLPPVFELPLGVDLWVPFQHTPADRPDLAERDNYIFLSVARLPAGKTLEQVRTHLATLAMRAENDDPKERAGVTVVAESLAQWLVGPSLSRMLWILLGAVVFVLLIGSVNVANLLLGRSTSRARELAVRGALGAGRARLVRQLLTESAVLSVIGGLLGIGLAHGGVRLLVALAPENTPRVSAVAVNGAALAFSLAVSLLAALLFGLIPALHLSQQARERSALSAEEVRTTRGVRGRASRRALVAVELALSVTLLVGAGLFGRSFVRLVNTDPGFSTESLVTFELALQGEQYPPERRVRTFEALRDRLDQLPGVASAAAMSSLPLGGGGFYLGRAFLPEGRLEPPDGEEIDAMWIVMQPGAFGALGIPLLVGRDFTSTDDSATTPVMIINRSFARRMFGTDDPLGKRVRSWRDENVYREVIGIVGDVRTFGARDSLRAIAYVPHAQDPWGQLAVVVRTEAPPASVIPAFRESVRAIDPGLAPSRVRTMNQIFRNSIANERAAALLMGVFAVVALTLASVGIYGVLSYLVAQRSQEIGIRMALGARRGDVTAMVLREAGGFVGLGLILGLVGAGALSRLATSLLFEVNPLDWPVFVGIPVALTAVAFAASWLPARRAAAVDPMVAIRAEG